MKEQLEQYVKRVKELHVLCQGSEATTKSGLIAPLFDLLGWDMADPRECLPEYRADFGKGMKSTKPVDWAFAKDSIFSFVVEAKECDTKLNKHGRTYAEQLGMYFNKLRTAEKSFCLGIYTNGVHWQFFTNLDDGSVMDKEPFLSWDIIADDPIPLDFLTLMQKSAFQPQLIKTFAEKGRKQSLLVNVLTKLLEPSDDFIRLAISVEMPSSDGTARSLETKALYPNVVKEWRPILANALQEWVKLKALDMALEPRNKDESMSSEEDDDEPSSDSTDKADGMRTRFWQGLLSRPKMKATRHASITAGEWTTFSAGSGVKGLPFNYVIRKTDGKVELFIDRGAGKAVENKEIFDGIHKSKTEIEKAFGGELSWQRLDDKQGCRIAYSTTTGGWKSNESEWPAIQDAMIEAMSRLEKALMPHLAKL